MKIWAVFIFLANSKNNPESNLNITKLKSYFNLLNRSYNFMTETIV